MIHSVRVTSSRTAAQPARRWGRRISRAVLCTALVALLLPAATAAAEYTAPRKLGRGFAGLTAGFLELPGHILKESRANGAAQGLTLGFATGLGAVVTRTLVGAWEFVTFPFPVPAGYKPILKPEYPWDHIDPN